MTAPNLTPMLSSVSSGRSQSHPAPAFNDAEKAHLIRVYQKHRWAVCQIKTPSKQGTGCLVGPNLILTNNHVIPDKETALQSKAIFFFIASQDPHQRHTCSEKHILELDSTDETGYFTTSPAHVIEELNPKTDLIVKKPQAAKEGCLDYTIVALKTDPYLAKIQNAICSIFDAPIPVPKMPLCIIHHPQNPDNEEKGLEYRKESQGRIICNGPYSTYYNAYTDRGSSGGLALDLAGYLVALHYQGDCECECSQKHRACNTGILVSKIAAQLLKEGKQEKIQAYAEKAKQEINMPITLNAYANPPLIDLPDEDPKFCGRNKELNELRNLCMQHSRVAITGLGGIGKTALAVEYANQYKSQRETVYFIDGSSPTTIELGLLRLASDLKVTGDKPTERLENLKAKLRGTPKCLFVFDGVDTEDGCKYLEAHLTTQTRCIIITTRMLEEGASKLKCASMELDTLSVEDSLDFIKKHTGQTESARELAEALGCLPLALTHACAYIRERGIAIQTFLEKFSEKQTALFGEKISKPTNEQTILTTWSMSLCFMSPETLDLFNFCSFLASENIPRSLLNLWIESHHPSEDIDKLIRELKSYSMLNTKRPEYYTIHKLVQQVIREKLSSDEANNYLKSGLSSFASVTSNYQSAIPETWPYMQEVAHHITTALLHMGNRYLDFDAARLAEIESLCSALGVYYSNTACNYEKSLFFLKRSVELSKKLTGEETPAVAQSLNNLSVTYQKLGKHEEACSTIKSALRIARESGAPTRMVASCLRSLGIILDGQEKYNEAYGCINESLQMYIRVYGNGHPDVATAYNDLGAILIHLYKHELAYDYLQKALQIRLKVFGDNHLDTIDSLTNIGALLHTQGRYKSALEYFKQSLTMTEKLTGPKHLDVVRALYNLCATLLCMGESDQARVNYERGKTLLESLEIAEDNEIYSLFSRLEASLATSQETTPLIVLERQVSQLMAHGRYNEAEPLLRRVLRTRKSLFPEKEWIHCLYNLGHALKALGKYDEAGECLEQSLAIYHRSWDQEEVELYHIYSRFGALLHAQRKLSEAHEFIEQSLTLAKRNFDNDHDGLIGAEMSLGELLKDMERYEEAWPHFENAMARVNRKYGNHHPIFAKILVSLGCMLCELGKKQDALALLTTARDIFSDQFPCSHPSIIEADNFIKIILETLDQSNLCQQSLSPLDTPGILRPISHQQSDIFQLSADQTGRIESLRNSAKAYQTQRKNDKAKKLLKWAYMESSQASSPESEIARRCRHELIQLMLRTHDPKLTDWLRLDYWVPLYEKTAWKQRDQS